MTIFEFLIYCVTLQLATGFLADLVYVVLITVSSLTWFGPLLNFDDPYFSETINATTAVDRLLD